MRNDTHIYLLAYAIPPKRQMCVAPRRIEVFSRHSFWSSGSGGYPTNLTPQRVIGKSEKCEARKEMQELYPVHAAAAVFPEMSEAEYQEFKEDIRKNGQSSPVSLWKGQLVDGRHRMRACSELGIGIKTRIIPDDKDPFVFVVSENLQRRHLNTAQRAMVGARIREHYDREAAERKRSTQAKPGEKIGVAKDTANLPEPCRGEARVKAGQAVKVSGKSIDAATHILKHGDDAIIKQVDGGKLSLNAAVNIVCKRTGTEPPKDDLRKQINADRSIAKQDLPRLIRIGRNLASLKADVIANCPGEWEKWLSQAVNMTVRDAERYIALAAVYTDDESVHHEDPESRAFDLVESL